ncbi:MAG: DUF935 family protein, partial [Gammaproteobacteria bacterium]|nr:DUF935 family protein [Gammaproteobacteria bacterium]
MARQPTLLDQYGNVIERRNLRRELAVPTLSGIRPTQRQYETTGMDPARLASILREAEHEDPTRYLEFAEDMEERDMHYLAVMGTRKRQVSQLNVSVEPADDSAEAEADAELVRLWIEREEIEDELFDMMDAVGKGFSVMEIMWDMSESQWFPRRLEYCLPTWFRYDWETKRRLQRRSEDGDLQWIDLEPGKFIEHRARAKSGIPIRGGLSRCAAWWWLFKNFGVKDWLRFIEAYGHPLRVGKYDRGSSPEEREILRRAVANIATDAAAIVPESMLVEFIESGGTAAHADLYAHLLWYCDASMSKGILGQTLTTDTGESGGGSYSLGKVHDEVREDIEHSDAKQLGATLTRCIAMPIVQLNRGTRPVYPKIVIGREERVTPEILSESLSKMKGLRVKAQEIRETLHLSEPEDGDEVLVVGSGVEGSEEPADPGNPGNPGMPPDMKPAQARALLRAILAGDDPPLLRPPAASANAGGTETGEDGPVGEMAGQLRGKAGPLVDEFVDPVREFVRDSADSLGAVRDWIDDLGVASIDVSEAQAAIGEALVAAELAGRYDTAETNSTRMAMLAASDEHARLPFNEQIEFFRGKLNLPTAAWTDIWQSQHDRAFVVAGAAKADLLTDLRGAVTGAIEDGTTLRDFRSAFDDIVARHGWTYNGGRDWRTRVIYGTNLRTSYAAGRLRQLKDNADVLPYWQYRHSHAAETPRPQHLAWDGMILRHDDPFWRTHYPPNGWGCGCYVVGLSERDLERLGRTGPDRSPEIRTRSVTVGQRGPHPRTVEVPEGIDPGWAYAPGQSLMRTYLEKAAVQSPAVAAAGVREVLARPRLRDGLHREWGEWLTAEPEDLGNLFITGAVAPGVLGTLKRDHDIELETVALSATRPRIRHGYRPDKMERGQALSEADLARLPDILAAPMAVLLDTGDDTLVYAFTTPDGGGRMGKIVYR